MQVSWESIKLYSHLPFYICLYGNIILHLFSVGKWLFVWFMKNYFGHCNSCYYCNSLFAFFPVTHFTCVSTSTLPINWTLATFTNLVFERRYTYPAYNEVAPSPCDLTQSFCDIYCCSDVVCYVLVSRAGYFNKHFMFLNVRWQYFFSLFLFYKTPDSIILIYLLSVLKNSGSQTIN